MDEINEKNKLYRRLPGTGYRKLLPTWAVLPLFFVIGIFVLLFRGKRVQLWQGEDHLLLVESDGYREFYKRFGYGDIQAIVIRKTSEATALNAGLAVVAVVLVALGAAATDAARWVLLSLAGFCLSLLLVNVAMGPACQCYIQTAVQTEELLSLNRLKRARRVLARIRPAIIAAQGRGQGPDLVAQTTEAPGTESEPIHPPAERSESTPSPTSGDTQAGLGS